MLINTHKMISISEAKENFSKIAKIVDKEKALIIMEDNKPKYVILDFDQFSMEATLDEDKLDTVADKVLKENILAFKKY